MCIARIKINVRGRLNIKSWLSSYDPKNIYSSRTIDTFFYLNANAFQLIFLFCCYLRAPSVRSSISDLIILFICFIIFLFFKEKNLLNRLLNDLTPKLRSHVFDKTKQSEVDEIIFLVNLIEATNKKETHWRPHSVLFLFFTKMISDKNILNTRNNPSNVANVHLLSIQISLCLAFHISIV